MIPLPTKLPTLISAVILAAILSLGCILYISNNPMKEAITEKKVSNMRNPQISSSFLIKNQDQAITDLIAKYYEVILNVDKKAYDKITVDDDSIDIDVLLRKMEYIVGYENQEIYVTQGAGNAVIVAYIVYDLKINSIHTLAPSIDQLLIKNVKGVPKLYFNELSLQEAKQLETIRSNKEVLALIQKVNNRFEAAIQSDTNLYDFYKSLTKQAMNE